MDFSLNQGGQEDLNEEDLEGFQQQFGFQVVDF